MQNNAIRRVLVGLLVLAGIYLITDHGQHVLPYLPFTFLLGCLAMHLFMHGGHGGHSGNNGHRPHHSHQDDENKPL